MLKRQTSVACDSLMGAVGMGRFSRLGLTRAEGSFLFEAFAPRLGFLFLPNEG